MALAHSRISVLACEVRVAFAKVFALSIRYNNSRQHLLGAQMRLNCGDHCRTRVPSARHAFVPRHMRAMASAPPPHSPISAIPARRH